MKIGQHLLVLACLILLSIRAPGHQEKSLRVLENRIEGLPERYGSCLIAYEKNQISINGKNLDLPKFTEGVLASKRNLNKDGEILFNVGVHWRLSIMASWDHDKNEKDSLPDYMIFRFYPNDKDYHFEVYINLEKPAIAGTKIFLTTYSREDGDVWIGPKELNANNFSSTQMELSIKESPELDWNKDM